MSHADPPPIATWLLEHWSPGRVNDALAGDLLEEFRSGRKDRTGPWYWRQVLSVIVIGSIRELLNHRTVLLFAAAWSMLTPSWLLVVTAIERRFNFNSRIMQLEFPWSTLSDLALLLAANLLFIWAGIIAYLIPYLWLRRNLRMRLLGQGVLAGIPVLLAVWAALIVLPKQFLHVQAADRASLASAPTCANPHLGPTEVRRIPPGQTWAANYSDMPAPTPVYDPRNAITDMRRSALLVRLPFLLCVLYALWGVESRLRMRSDGITL
jgi:hypothetical protein